MSLVCAQCSRVNPTEAAYCYHDGAALTGRAGGPINPGAALFPAPFVFPNGQACRNFDQLATTCQQNWPAALDLLRQGFFASFFGGLGRVDLAVAAQEAAKFPDPDRGLDQLLAKLPSQVVEPPKLQIEPSVINLGQLKLGTDRTIELRLHNAGMRLLYGSVASDCKWLTLGEVPGQPQKVFQFGDEAAIAVQVRGQHLRAGIRPLEGTLAVDSNGGTATVTVRADVPVTPFAGGLFDGAVTPRQVAEKAKASPKEAASYFEGGRVAAWFQSNGWTYPVQGPPMSGMGAVQQFFEALGVARPPQVQVTPPSFALEGKPGTVVPLTIELTSPERKVVYGWATTDKPWIQIGKTKLTGRAASIPIRVTVPDRAGTQQATLTVVGNGQQRFAVPITVAVIGGADILDAELVPAPLEAQLVDEPLAATLAIPETPARMPAPMAAVPAAPAHARPPSVPNLTLDAVRPPAVAVAAVPPVVRSPEPAMRASEPTVTFLEEPAKTAEAPSTAETDFDLNGSATLVARPAALQGPARAGLKRRWMHLVPAALLAVALLVTCIRDAIVAMLMPPVRTHETPLLTLNFDYNFGKPGENNLGNTMMVGLVRNFPEDGKNAEPKRLTYGLHGETNSVVLRIDGKDRVFGKAPAHGRWAKFPTDAGNPPTGKTCAFEFSIAPIVVTQEVRLVRGEPVEVSPGEYKRVLDTCLFRYRIENKDKKPHDVGLRFLLDTYIGSNDDVPFTLPGVQGMVDTSRELVGPDVPDFIQVLEHPDLENPGMIAQLNLRLGAERPGLVFEPPHRMLLTAHPMVQQRDHPGVTKEAWEIPLASIKEAHDSSVVLYWDPKELPAGKFRELAFTYGLGNVSIGNRAKLGLTVGGAMLVGRDLTVVALVADPQEGQIVELLQLPPGLTLAKDSQAKQAVPPSTEVNKDGRPIPSPVTWRVRATRDGDFPIVVETHIGGERVTQTRRVTITRARLF